MQVVNSSLTYTLSCTHNIDIQTFSLVFLNLRHIIFNTTIDRTRDYQSHAPVPALYLANLEEMKYFVYTIKLLLRDFPFNLKGATSRYFLDDLNYG